MSRVFLWLILAGIIRVTGAAAQETGDRRSGAAVADNSLFTIENNFPLDSSMF